MTDQAERLREIAREANASAPQAPRQPDDRCRCIAVTSGKGGVGKTTLALALAAGFARLQKKVLLMDADLGLANAHILLGLSPTPNISHVVAGECGIDDIIVEAAPGVHLAPGASGLEDLANLDAARLERLRAALVGLESKYDYLIMDTGAGIGSTVIGFARHADLVLLVLTPDPSSLFDAYATVKVLREKNAGNVAVAVNLASSEREGRAVFDRLNNLVVNFLKKPLELYAVLPPDSEVQTMGRTQKHLAGGSAGNRFYGGAAMLARRICGAPTKTGKDGGFFARFFGG